MLAQGQSSSAKRGGLAVVSSGLTFLKKKGKKKGFKLLMRCDVPDWILEQKKDVSGKT